MATWTTFRFGKLAGEQITRGTRRGEVHTTPSQHPEAPAPYYWNVVDQKSRRPLGLVADGFGISVEDARQQCLVAMR